MTKKEPRIQQLIAVFREAILAELKRQGRSRYWLANKVEQSSANTVYQYLRGEVNLGSHRLAEILEILQIKLNPTAKVSKPAKKKKR